MHKASFIDDPTRIYRAAKFAGRFGWKLDKTTAELAGSAVRKKLPALLSRERLKKIYMKAHPRA